MIENILLTTRQPGDMKLSEVLPLVIIIKRQNGVNYNTAKGWKKAMQILTKSVNQN